jgi:hypothetical protein
MSKTTITRLFIGSGIAIVAGAALAVAGIWLAIENDAFILSGQDIVGLHGGTLAWAGLGLGLVGALVFTGGLIGGFVSWIAALTNTWRLDSKTWFAVLLLLGIFNLGFFGMVAYLLAGPDGTADTGSTRALPTPAVA